MYSNRQASWAATPSAITGSTPSILPCSSSTSPAMGRRCASFRFGHECAPGADSWGRGFPQPSRSFGRTKPDVPDGKSEQPLHGTPWSYEQFEANIRARGEAQLSPEVLLAEARQFQTSEVFEDDFSLLSITFA